jgi:hypothetical protein
LAENDLKPWRKDMWCIPQVDGEWRPMGSSQLPSRIAEGYTSLKAGSARLGHDLKLTRQPSAIFGAAMINDASATADSSSH